MELHTEVKALLVAMKELEEFLSQNDEFWADHVRRAADEVANSDAHGLKCFLGLFGGMGWLNDLVLHYDGKLLRAENDELDALRARAWGLANSLRREIG